MQILSYWSYGEKLILQEETWNNKGLYHKHLIIYYYYY